MNVRRLNIENFRGVKRADLFFDGHVLFVGGNNVGKSTVCEALDLILGLPLANVQLGVSVENQKVADDRIPWLLKCPAARRFLSCEPLLSAVDLCQVKAGILAPHLPLHRVDVLRGGTWNMPTGLVPPPEYTNHSDMERLDWVIIGGESGFGARACNLDWIRTIVQQCKAAGVACFVKQLGADPYYDPPVMTLAHAGLGPKNIRDPKGGNMAEWPEDMRVRDFPGAVPA